MQTSQSKLKLSAINADTWVGRNAEVTETVGRKVDTVAQQEVRYRKEGVNTLKEGDFEYRLCLKDEDTASEGVGLMVKT